MNNLEIPCQDNLKSVITALEESCNSCWNYPHKTTHSSSRTAVVAPDCLKVLFPIPGCSLCVVQLACCVPIKDLSQASGWKWASWAQGQHHFRAACVILAMQHPSGRSAFQRQPPWHPCQGFYLFIVHELLTFPKGKYHTLNLPLNYYLSLDNILPLCLFFFFLVRNSHITDVENWGLRHCKLTNSSLRTKCKFFINIVIS